MIASSTNPLRLQYSCRERETFIQNIRGSKKMAKAKTAASLREIHCEKQIIRIQNLRGDPSTSLRVTIIRSGDTSKITSLQQPQLPVNLRDLNPHLLQRQWLLRKLITHIIFKLPDLTNLFRWDFIRRINWIQRA